MKIKISLLQSKLCFFVFLLALFAVFGFFKVESANAVFCNYQEITGGNDPPIAHVVEVPTEADCTAICAGPGNSQYLYCVPHATQESAESGSTIQEMIDADRREKATNFSDNKPDVCGGLGGWNLISPTAWFNCLLLVILRFMGFLLEIAASLFNWIINPVNMNAVIDNAAIYNAWALVRDTLNIAFILVLLFSAFATIFQVDKFSYKKILLTLIIMALLVNFSFPIARFIIDLSNVLMYYFVNALHVGDAPSGSFFVKMTQDTTLSGIINPRGGVDNNTAFLLASVVFVFIFAITLLIIAVLFVVRTVALAILVIFSSLAFTGSVVPSLSTHASKWWDNLFKYAFFGPIMVFMLYIASSMMGYISQSSLRGGMDKIAANQSSSPGFIADIAFFSIPIIILWIGLGMAQSMSIAGAGMVTDRGKKFAGWAGKKFSGYNFGKSQYDAYSAARKKRRDEIQKGRFMGTVGNKFNKWQDTAVGKIPLVGGAARKRAENMRRTEAAKDVREKAADLKGAKIEELSVEVNNSFNATGAIDPSKVNKTSAGSAQAFMDKSADDRKTFVEDALQTKGGTKAPGILDSGLEKVLAAAPPNITASITMVTSSGPTTPGYQDALRQVTSYINRRTEEVVNQHTK